MKTFPRRPALPGGGGTSCSEYSPSSHQATGPSNTASPSARRRASSGRATGANTRLPAGRRVLNHRSRRSARSRRFTASAASSSVAGARPDRRYDWLACSPLTGLATPSSTSACALRSTMRLRACASHGSGGQGAAAARRCGFTSWSCHQRDCGPSHSSWPKYGRSGPSAAGSGAGTVSSAGPTLSTLPRPGSDRCTTRPPIAGATSTCRWPSSRRTRSGADAAAAGPAVSSVAAAFAHSATPSSRAAARRRRGAVARITSCAWVSRRPGCRRAAFRSGPAPSRLPAYRRTGRRRPRCARPARRSG